MPRFLRALVLSTLVLAPLGLAGCRSDDGRLSPVFGAVFGLEGAQSIPFKVGRIPEPEVQPADRVIGRAANQPGQCIFVTPADRRFRAPCPETYTG